MQNDNKKFWDRLSFLYDFITNKDKKAYDNIINQIKNELSPEKLVLELSTGTGLIGLAIAPFCKTVEATDFSEEMVKRAINKEKPKNIVFSVQDATNLPYKEKSFDVVVVANALHIMPDPQKALMNIRRVLKDDGILIAPTFTRSSGFKEKLFEKPMEFFGFRTFSRWTFDEYITFLQSNNWKIIKSNVVRARFSVAFVIAKK